MSFWKKLLHALGFQRSSGTLTFNLEGYLLESLQDLADQEQRSESELAAELLAYALAQRDAAVVNLERWRSLSPREQQVVALVCQDYTNQQIAARLVISPETVKTHVRNAARKFGLHSKAELRQALGDWDFSAW